MKKVNFSKEQVSFDAHNLVFVPKQRRRLSAFIRVCAIFAGLFFACLQFANAQDYFARRVSTHNSLTPTNSSNSF